jgi:uncharacterized protein
MAIPSPRPGAAALVTGASSGIGEQLARQLAARGHDLVVVARRSDRLEALAAELGDRHRRRVEVIAADVSEPPGRDAVLAEIDAFGLDIDVLIASAGFGMGGPFLEQDAERIQLMVRTNVESTFLLTRALAPAMVARGSGAIMLVSSLAGNQPMPHFGAYAATKAAVTSLAETLSLELGSHGVTVTALCPGGVRTEFSQIASMEESERRVPNALLIGPEECAKEALAGLEAGRRIVMPRRAVRAFAWFGDHAPRRVWLPLCRWLLG